MSSSCPWNTNGRTGQGSQVPPNFLKYKYGAVITLFVNSLNQKKKNQGKETSNTFFLFWKSFFLTLFCISAFFSSLGHQEVWHLKLLLSSPYQQKTSILLSLLKGPHCIAFQSSLFIIYMTSFHLPQNGPVGQGLVPLDVMQPQQWFLSKGHVEVKHSIRQKVAGEKVSTFRCLVQYISVQFQLTREVGSYEKLIPIVFHQK